MVKIQNLLDNDEKANRAYHHMKEKNKIVQIELIILYLLKKTIISFIKIRNF